jgi:hypothetical protein
LFSTLCKLDLNENSRFHSGKLTDALSIADGEAVLRNVLEGLRQGDCKQCVTGVMGRVAVLGTLCCVFVTVGRMWLNEIARRPR